MNKIKLTEQIFIYENVMSNKINIIKDLENIFNVYEKNFVDASINDKEYNKELRSCTVFSLFNDVSEIHLKEYQLEKAKLNDKINHELSGAFLDYIKDLGLKIKERESWEILKYEQTQKLTWHNDNGESHPCLISFVYYINDDYEGGEIQFKDKLDSVPYKPKANSLIIFPSDENHIHRVLPIVKGVKYAAISFGK